MIKVDEKIYHTADHQSQLPTLLEGIAKWHQDKGFHVNRGSHGSVSVLLQDGEIHFESRGHEIIQIVYLKPQEDKE